MKRNQHAKPDVIEDIVEDDGQLVLDWEGGELRDERKTREKIERAQRFKDMMMASDKEHKASNDHYWSRIRVQRQELWEKFVEEHGHVIPLGYFAKRKLKEGKEIGGANSFLWDLMQLTFVVRECSLHTGIPYMNPADNLVSCYTRPFWGGHVSSSIKNQKFFDLVLEALRISAEHKKKTGEHLSELNALQMASDNMEAEKPAEKSVSKRWA